jgi:3-hydroxybutyryl-CoA dehydratase
VDEKYCQSIGLNQVIVHGLFTASAVSRLVGMNLPGKHAKLLQVNLSWPRPVHVGDEIKVMGIVQEISESTKTMILKISGNNQKNEKVLKGSVIVGVGI